MQHENCYETFDLGLAAALRTCGYKLIGFEPTANRRVAFVFEATPSLDDAIQRFWIGQLPVDALSYFGSIKLFKTQIHSVA